MNEVAINGTPLDEISEEDWTTSCGLGKFNVIAEEKLYDGFDPDSTTGNSSEWHWWAGRYDAYLAILEESSSGFVSVERFETQDDLDKAWEDRERQYLEYVYSECEDGMNCEGCTSCECR